MTKPEVDVMMLARLARLEVSEDELTRLQAEIPGILAFVDTIQKVAADSPKTEPSVHNVMRADENPHESGIHTEALLAAAPMREGDRVAVKQVLSRKK